MATIDSFNIRIDTSAIERLRAALEQIPATMRSGTAAFANYQTQADRIAKAQKELADATAAYGKALSGGTSTDVSAAIQKLHDLREELIQAGLAADEGASKFLGLRANWGVLAREARALADEFAAGRWRQAFGTLTVIMTQGIGASGQFLGILGAVGGALLTAGKASYSFMKSMDEARETLRSTGAVAGLTAGQLLEMAKAASEAGKQSSAAYLDLGTRLAGQAQMNASNIQASMKIFDDYVRGTGKSADDFVKTMENPIKALRELYRQGGLSDSEMRLVENLNLATKNAEIQELAIRKLGEAHKGAADRMNYMSQTFELLARGWSNFQRGLGQLISPAVDEQKIKDLENLIRFQKESARERLTDFSGSQAALLYPSRRFRPVEENQAEVKALKERTQAQYELNQEKSHEAEISERIQASAKELKKYDPIGTQLNETRQQIERSQTALDALQRRSTQGGRDPTDLERENIDTHARALDRLRAAHRNMRDEIDQEIKKRNDNITVLQAERNQRDLVRAQIEAQRSAEAITTDPSRINQLQNTATTEVQQRMLTDARDRLQIEREEGAVLKAMNDNVAGMGTNSKLAANEIKVFGEVLKNSLTDAKALRDALNFKEGQQALSGMLDTIRQSVRESNRMGAPVPRGFEDFLNPGPLGILQERIDAYQRAQREKMSQRTLAPDYPRTMEGGTTGTPSLQVPIQPNIATRAANDNRIVESQNKLSATNDNLANSLRDAARTFPDTYRNQSSRATVQAITTSQAIPIPDSAPIKQSTEALNDNRATMLLSEEMLRNLEEKAREYDTIVAQGNLTEKQRTDIMRNSEHQVSQYSEVLRGLTKNYGDAARAADALTKILAANEMRQKEFSVQQGLEQQRRALEDTNKELELQLQHVGKLNERYDVGVELAKERLKLEKERELGVAGPALEAELERRRPIIEEQVRLKNAIADADRVAKEWKKTADDVASAIGKAFDSAIEGGKRFKDILLDLGKDISKIGIQKFITDPLKRMLEDTIGAPGAGGGKGSGLIGALGLGGSGGGGLFGGLFGGTGGSGGTASTQAGGAGSNLTPNPPGGSATINTLGSLASATVSEITSGSQQTTTTQPANENQVDTGPTYPITPIDREEIRAYASGGFQTVEHPYGTAVRGGGGPDNNLVQIKATQGERIVILTPEQQSRFDPIKKHIFGFQEGGELATGPYTEYTLQYDPNVRSFAPSKTPSEAATRFPAKLPLIEHILPPDAPEATIQTRATTTPAPNSQAYAPDFGDIERTTLSTPPNSQAYAPDFGNAESAQSKAQPASFQKPPPFEEAKGPERKQRATEEKKEGESWIKRNWPWLALGGVAAAALLTYFLARKGNKRYNQAPPGSYRTDFLARDYKTSGLPSDLRGRLGFQTGGELMMPVTGDPNWDWTGEPQITGGSSGGPMGTDWSWGTKAYNRATNEDIIRNTPIQEDFQYGKTFYADMEGIHNERPKSWGPERGTETPTQTRDLYLPEVPRYSETLRNRDTSLKIPEDIPGRGMDLGGPIAATVHEPDQRKLPFPRSPLHGATQAAITVAARAAGALANIITDPLSIPRRLISPTLENIEQGPRLGSTIERGIMWLGGDELYEPKSAPGRVVMAGATGGTAGAITGPIGAGLGFFAGAASQTARELGAGERTAMGVGLVAGLGGVGRGGFRSVGEAPGEMRLLTGPKPPLDESGPAQGGINLATGESRGALVPYRAEPETYGGIYRSGFLTPTSLGQVVPYGHDFGGVTRLFTREPPMPKTYDVGGGSVLATEPILPYRDRVTPTYPEPPTEYNLPGGTIRADEPILPYRDRVTFNQPEPPSYFDVGGRRIPADTLLRDAGAAAERSPLTPTFENPLGTSETYSFIEGLRRQNQAKPGRSFGEVARDFLRDESGSVPLKEREEILSKFKLPELEPGNLPISRATGAGPAIGLNDLDTAITGAVPATRTTPPTIELSNFNIPRFQAGALPGMTLGLQGLGGPQATAPILPTTATSNLTSGLGTPTGGLPGVDTSLSTPNIPALDISSPTFVQAPVNQATQIPTLDIQATATTPATGIPPQSAAGGGAPPYQPPPPNPPPPPGGGFPPSPGGGGGPIWYIIYPDGSTLNTGVVAASDSRQYNWQDFNRDSGGRYASENQPWTWDPARGWTRMRDGATGGPGLPREGRGGGNTGGPGRASATGGMAAEALASGSWKRPDGGMGTLTQRKGQSATGGGKKQEESWFQKNKKWIAIGGLALGAILAAFLLLRKKKGLGIKQPTLLSHTMKPIGTRDLGEVSIPRFQEGGELDLTNLPQVSGVRGFAQGGETTAAGGRSVLDILTAAQPAYEQMHPGQNLLKDFQSAYGHAGSHPFIAMGIGKFFNSSGGAAYKDQLGEILGTKYPHIKSEDAVKQAFIEGNPPINEVLGASKPTSQPTPETPKATQTPEQIGPTLASRTADPPTELRTIQETIQKQRQNRDTPTPPRATDVPIQAATEITSSAISQGVKNETPITRELRPLTTNTIPDYLKSNAPIRSTHPDTMANDLNALELARIKAGLPDFIPGGTTQTVGGMGEPATSGSNLRQGGAINQSFDTMMGGSRVERFLDLAMHHESGFRNIHQNIIPAGGGYNPSTGSITGPSSAQGYLQITNQTWRSFAPLAGVSTRDFPNAMSAPYEVQRAVGRAIVTTSGTQHWMPYNANLRAAALKEGFPMRGPIRDETQFDIGVAQNAIPRAEELTTVSEKATRLGTGSLPSLDVPTQLTPMSRDYGENNYTQPESYIDPIASTTNQPQTFDQNNFNSGGFGYGDFFGGYTLGYQEGGSQVVDYPYGTQVQGGGGPDNQLVQIKATQGERIVVLTPEQQNRFDQIKEHIFGFSTGGAIRATKANHFAEGGEVVMDLQQQMDQQQKQMRFLQTQLAEMRENKPDDDQKQGIMVQAGPDLGNPIQGNLPLDPRVVTGISNPQEERTMGLLKMGMSLGGQLLKSGLKFQRGGEIYLGSYAAGGRVGLPTQSRSMGSSLLNMHLGNTEFDTIRNRSNLNLTSLGSTFNPGEMAAGAANLHPGERPIIAHLGERVLNQEETLRYETVQSKEPNGAKNYMIHAPINIQAPNPEAFHQSSTQIQTKMASAMELAIARNL